MKYIPFENNLNYNTRSLTKQLQHSTSKNPVKCMEDLRNYWPKLKKSVVYQLFMDINLKNTKFKTENSLNSTFLQHYGQGSSVPKLISKQAPTFRKIF